ncbi:hypothetical protein [Azospirillum soli]|uniref:hypothetical protein n=1 Tax=Azospirillum soli TaxID=1304799 RepID=UPI001AE2FA0A|nr:hypothetical protein [Azospirillum soli]MBP2315510.1 site-specific DNA-adenine methylase [Azospirillum soli]
MFVAAVLLPEDVRMRCGDGRLGGVAWWCDRMEATMATADNDDLVLLYSHMIANLDRMLERAKRLPEPDRAMVTDLFGRHRREWAKELRRVTN